MSVSDIDFENFEELRSLKSLKSLIIYYTSIKDLSPVFDLPKLNKLEIHSQKGININGIEKLKNLEELCLTGISLKDVKVLSKLEKLKTLNLSGNKIEYISPLISVMKKGSYLKIDGNKLDLSKGSNDIKDIQKLIKAGVRVEY